MKRNCGKLFILLCCLFAPMSLLWANGFMQGSGSMPESSNYNLEWLGNSDVVAGL